MDITTPLKSQTQTLFDILIFDTVLQSNGSYISSNGRVIWMSQESYKMVNTVATKFVKKKKYKK